MERKHTRFAMSGDMGTVKPASELVGRSGSARFGWVILCRDRSFCEQGVYGLIFHGEQRQNLFCSSSFV